MTGRIGKLKRNNTIYKSIIISFSIIIAVVLILEVSLYYRAKSVIKSTIEYYNEVLLEGVADKVQSSFENVERYMNSMVENNKIKQVLYSDTYNYDDAMAAMYEIQKANLTGYITDVNVVIDSADVVISKRNVLKADEFFEKEVKVIDENYSIEKWREEFFSRVLYEQYFTPKKIKEGNYEKNIIYYCQSYPKNKVKPEDIKGRIFILIDADKLLKEIQIAGNIDGGDLFVLNQKRDIMMSTSEDETILRESLKKMTAATQDVLANPDENKICVYTQTKIGLNYWTSARLIDRNYFLRELYNYRNLMVAVLFIFLLAAVVFVGKMTKKTYAPIKKVLSMINTTDYTPEKNYSNEMEAVISYIDSVKNKRDENETKAYKHLKISKKMLLNRMLHERLKIDEHISEVMEINFPYDFLCVVTVKAKNRGVFLNEYTEENSLMNFGIANIFQEIIDEMKMSKRYVVENDIITAIINFDNKDDESFESYIGKFLEKFANTIKETLGIFLNIGISDIWDEPEQISDCYSDAVIAMEYKSDYDSSSINFFSKIKGEVLKKKLYIYSFENEKCLVNFIRQGDLSGINNILDEILMVNIKLRLEKNMVNLLCDELMGTLMRTVSNLDIGEDVIDGLLIKSELFKTRSLKENILMIKAKYERVCDLVASMDATKTNSLVVECEKYVKDNYMNFDMGVAMIADHFEVTRQNIFNVFKQHLGISPSDYIVSVRIEKAKELLRETRMNNTQIANAVGFTSDVSFVRVFKKAEGVTPKKFRDSLPD